MNHHLDTIAAQATAAGEGGIAIVRVSGSRCEEILSQVFRAKNGKPLVNRMLTFVMSWTGKKSSMKRWRYSCARRTAIPVRTSRRFTAMVRRHSCGASCFYC